MGLNNYPRISVRSLDEQRQLLAEPAAVLLVWFEWSGIARHALWAIDHWHERWHVDLPKPVWPLYVLNGDDVPALSTWVRDTLQENGGYGSLYLFKRGAIAARVPSVIDAGLATVSKLCRQHFADVG